MWIYALERLRPGPALGHSHEPVVWGEPIILRETVDDFLLLLVQQRNPQQAEKEQRPRSLSGLPLDLHQRRPT
jgi:hypothetical protein